MGEFLVQLLGKIVGTLVTWLAAAWKSQARNLKFLLIAAIIIAAAPPVSQYWLSRVQMPDVPLSAIIMTFAATAFMVVFCVSMYVLTQMVGQLVVSQRIAGYTTPRAPLENVKATGGDFIPMDDAKLRQREDIEILKSKGILQETDVEGLVSEIGHAQLLKMRGRTE
jgi:predicted PurR-regulated permease PerM